MKLDLPISNASSARGADMGRPDLLPGDIDAVFTLQVERLAWIDGDYDQGGAYWGNSGDYIYRAVSTEEMELATSWGGDAGTGHVEIFTRARNLPSALKQLRERFPNARLEF